MSALLRELHEQRLTSGYFGCCGMSRIRGHAELCSYAIAAAARKGGDVQQAPGETPQSGGVAASPKVSR